MVLLTKAGDLYARTEVPFSVEEVLGKKHLKGLGKNGETLLKILIQDFNMRSFNAEKFRQQHISTIKCNSFIVTKSMVAFLQ
jgi:hypothetical protein